MIDLRGLEIKENNLTIFNNDITGRVTSINYSPTSKDYWFSYGRCSVPSKRVNTNSAR